MTDAKLTNERVYGEGLTVWRQDDGRVWFSTPHIQNQHLLTVEEVADLVRWLAGEPSAVKSLLQDMVREGEFCQECAIITQFRDRIAAVIGSERTGEAP